MKSSAFSRVWWPPSSPVFELLSKSCPFFAPAGVSFSYHFIGFVSILDLCRDVHIVGLLFDSAASLSLLPTVPSDGRKASILMWSKWPVRFFMSGAFLYDCSSRLCPPLGNDVTVFESPFPSHTAHFQSCLGSDGTSSERSPQTTLSKMVTPPSSTTPLLRCNLLQDSQLTL